MKICAADLPLLRWHLLALCLCALLGVIVVYGSAEYARSSQKDRLRAQGMLAQARLNLATARQDQENMGKYADEYSALIERNIIGDEQRLDWLEGMEKIRRNSAVPSFSYQIGPQVKYLSQPVLDSGNFDFYYSEMKLQLELLHEQQLLDFFDALGTQIKGHYHLQGCSLQRNDSARLHAECSGGWLTLKNREVAK